MTANTLPSGINDLFLLADRIQLGLEKRDRWLRLNIREEFTALLETARNTEDAFTLARARKAAAGKHFVECDTELTAWLAKARLVVILALGGTWSELWLEAGFTHRRTHVPKRLGARIALAGRLATFFTSNQEYTVPFAEVTAEEATARFQKIKQAEAAVRTTKAIAARDKQHRDAAEKALRHKMWCVVRLLQAVLNKTDPRWQDFGLNQPRPGKPSPNVTNTPIAEIIPFAAFSEINTEVA